MQILVRQVSRVNKQCHYTKPNNCSMFCFSNVSPIFDLEILVKLLSPKAMQILIWNFTQVLWSFNNVITQSPITLIWILTKWYPVYQLLIEKFFIYWQLPSNSRACCRETALVTTFLKLTRNQIFKKIIKKRTW